MVSVLITQTQRPVPSGGTQRAMWLGPWCRGCQSPRMFWTVWSSTPLTLHLTTPPPLRASGTRLKVRSYVSWVRIKAALIGFNILSSIKGGYSGSVGLCADSKAAEMLCDCTDTNTKPEKHTHTKASTHVRIWLAPIQHLLFLILVHQCF